MDVLADKYSARIERLEDRLRRQERELLSDEAEYDARKREERPTMGETVLSFFMGRRTRSVSTIATKRRLAEKAKLEIEETREEIAELEEEIAELEEEMNRTIARSISRPITNRLHKRPVVGKVLAVFDHACDLVDQNDELTALVTPQIGDGPLNIVVDGDAGFFSGSNPGSPVTLGQRRIATAGWWVDLTGASVWEPSPDWDKLRARRTVIVSQLPLLLALCLHHAPGGSLLALLAAPDATQSLNEAIFSEARKAAKGLRESCVGDLERLQERAVRLAGLGNGLTPAGDDFLAGAMLWAWLTHPFPEHLCRTVVDVAAPRTTTLSGALLRATARGECAISWHRLLDALSAGRPSEIELAVRRVLAHGATSGADTLSGFLCMAS